MAAAQIYNMLMDYRGSVTVKIDGIAASAASVIAMAGTRVLVSPVSMLMIHNPATMAMGDAAEMQKAIAMLDEVKESIINAYELKTGMQRLKLARLMDAETWMNAHKAVELGFADGILYAKEEESLSGNPVEALIFSRMAVTNSLLSKFPKAAASAAETEPPAPDPAEAERGTLTPAATPETIEQPTGTPIESLYKRLSLISH